MHADERGHEQVLRRAAIAGDEQAWRAWYDASLDGLYAYVLWRCAGLRDVADDIVQDTWLTAVRRIRDFEPERASFLTWLRSIAANFLRNHFRKKSRRGADMRVCRQTGMSAPPDEAEHIALALAALPDHYEAVLRAKYVERHSVAEIAAARGDSVKAVESLLGRARQAFKEMYLSLGTPPDEPASRPEEVSHP